MSDDPTSRGDGALEALRAEFDGAFARAPAARPGEVSLLALRAGGEPVAVRVLDVAGLLPAGRVAPVPSRRAELLGVAGLRGTILPVYALARLLGRPADEARWMLLAATDAGGLERVAFACEGFEGHVTVPAADVHAATGGGVRAHVAAVVRVGGGFRPLLHVPSLVRAVTGRAGAPE
jgi:purine-binding chemotaxis protein CheW